MAHITAIYPAWPKLPGQSVFHMPPHGPVCMAAEIPDEHEVRFFDGNVCKIDENIETDLVLISAMLTSQIPELHRLASHFRGRGIPVLAGGIAVMLHADEVAGSVDSVFLGEVEDGRLARALGDWRNGGLKPRYDYLSEPPPIESVGPARRSILDDELYMVNRVKMVDLTHASRGCKFNCPPCPTKFLGGLAFRPRPLQRIVEELESIDNKRLFFVDNSLAQNKEWLLGLFEVLKPLKRQWVAHPILDDDEVLENAREAGAWFVYQAVTDTSDLIRERIRRLHKHDIGVEAAVILGFDSQTPDQVKSILDMLAEERVEMAEFSILTPFPQTKVMSELEQEGRILHYDWSRYTASEVVFRPKNMSPDELQELYHMCWREFYRERDQQDRMGELVQRVILREMTDRLPA